MRPFLNRSPDEIALTRARWPDGGMPMNAPLCVPVPLQRTAAVTPSAIRYSTVVRRSGNAVRYACTRVSTPSRPAGSPPGSRSR